MERWGFLFSVMSSPIVYFLTMLLAVCPNINPTILCAHVCDVNYAACYCIKHIYGKCIKHIYAIASNIFMEITLNIFMATASEKVNMVKVLGTSSFRC